MTFFVPYTNDGKPYRDEDYLSPRKPSQSQRNSRVLPSDLAIPVPDNNQVPGASMESVTSNRRHVVIADPVAFRYLEEDTCVKVFQRRAVLLGYESYLVEQWACSRQSPTLVIVTYTGDQKHSVVVGVLSVPAEEASWSARVCLYYKAIQKFHARPKDTDLGQLMVTNLSSFPSALTVIPIPDGDIRQHRQTFIINENLKRLGCSGRSGLTLTEPTEATLSKFQQLYKINERVPVKEAVMDLIKLCQIALYMFEKLDREYVDGLLCDMTETGISNWWTEVGAEHYNFEPTDGILGPSTVAALLGMLMGVRNRLHWYGEPVSKDVFEIDCTKRGIGHFQKSQKLEKTRRLDRQTLLKLYSITAKAASGEGWGVQKAVKSTVTEIGGKRGEIVMGMVSGKDKGGIADIETLDIDKFISLAYGERPKWLWQGKPRRSVSEQPARDPEFSGGLVWKEETNDINPRRAQPSLPIEEEAETKRGDEASNVYSAYPSGSATSVIESPADKDALRKTVFKSVAGKMSDARSGFGRFKDAVGGGLRGHGKGPSMSTKEDFGDISGGVGAYNSALVTQNPSISSSPGFAGPPRAFTWKNKPEEYLAAMKRGDLDAMPGLPEDARLASPSTAERHMNKKSNDSQKSADTDGNPSYIGAEVRKELTPTAPPKAGSIIGDHDLEGPLLDAERNCDPAQLALSRRHSVHCLAVKRPPNEARWARRVSFGDAEEAVLTWTEIVEIEDTTEDLGSLLARGELARHLNDKIDVIVRDVEPWAIDKLKALQGLNNRYAREKDDIQGLFHQLNHACQRVKMDSDAILTEERDHLTKSIKEVDVLLARLEYEMNVLLQKVIDVEDGIITFERQVEDVEKRAEELKAQLETEGWLHWLVRTITGIGTGPHITRSS